MAERELPDSQCGFRKGRGCIDMTFVVKQLAEKALEHSAKQFFIFVDLRKAYDSVTRGPLDSVREARCAKKNEISTTNGGQYTY